jgi:AcrR family transcriptional regulator
VGRKPNFDDKAIYAALGRILAENGQATLADIREATGLSTGSLYHRFGSREGLMAEAWLFAVWEFQQRFLAALNREGFAAGVEAALETPRFCRREPDLSLVLVCCRSSEFLCGELAPELRARAANANTLAMSAIADFSRRIDRPLMACQLALVAFPLGAVRMFLPKRPVPPEIDDYVRKAVAVTLSMG